MTQYVKKILTLGVILSTIFYTGLVTAHGNVTLESDVCVRNMSGSMVHLSTYQPQYDPQAEYCTEIPHEGETFWVLDLIDHALRSMPIDVKVVRGSGDSSSDTVASLYSTDHSDGVIKGAFNLEKGDYTLFVTGIGIPSLHYEYPLHIQTANYKDMLVAALPYIIAFMLIAFLTDKYLKRRQLLH
ncbi:hypothetical protein SAMN05216302_10402 [Nitrosomonas aestuarii]|uniref:Uncharacterized protein n=1 Tax=Nitrosomonas aestuarii TaxID=52441 RepID=A0A1I4FNM6_9PROT|nr:hypothetical protein [Nitrosomonas aestuarii]SFL19173.1 hypothetical protein SAMN05216302_10402 [Nitrosomonas aestuarii]